MTPPADWAKNMKRLLRALSDESEHCCDPDIDLSESFVWRHPTLLPPPPPLGRLPPKAREPGSKILLADLASSAKQYSRQLCTKRCHLHCYLYIYIVSQSKEEKKHHFTETKITRLTQALVLSASDPSLSKKQFGPRGAGRLWDTRSHWEEGVWMGREATGNGLGL